MMLASCNRAEVGKAAEAAPVPVPAGNSVSPVPSAPSANPESEKNAPQPEHVDGARAMRYTREIVAYGPRWNGSPAHVKVEDYLRRSIKAAAPGAILEEDAFTPQTPVGPLPVRNFLAKFPGIKDGVIVIASHYDTNYPLRKTNYVGANDGACTSALLLELAHHLQAGMGKTAPGKRDGYSVWLLWDDAEEAIQEDKIAWTDDDSLYGVRHLADTWSKDGTIKRMKAFLLLDMVGYSELSVMRDANSTGWLEDMISDAADRLTYRSYFFARNTAVEDDHIPFAKLGVPVADLIDFEYGYNNVYWHTPEDTVDKLSAKSLEIVGSTTLETVKMLDRR